MTDIKVTFFSNDYDSCQKIYTWLHELDPLQFDILWYSYLYGKPQQKCMIENGELYYDEIKITKKTVLFKTIAKIKSFVNPHDAMMYFFQSDKSICMILQEKYRKTNIQNIIKNHYIVKQKILSLNSISLPLEDYVKEMKKLLNEKEEIEQDLYDQSLFTSY